jgi:hypothetical protein
MCMRLQWQGQVRVPAECPVINSWLAFEFGDHDRLGEILLKVNGMLAKRGNLVKRFVLSQGEGERSSRGRRKGRGPRSEEKDRELRS